MARKAGLTQIDIVDAAVAVVDEHGLRRPHPRPRSPAKLGVQPPSLYHHVGAASTVCGGAVVRHSIDHFAQ